MVSISVLVVSGELQGGYVLDKLWGTESRYFLTEVVAFC